MKLYGYYRSSATYRVRIALNLKGLEYDYHSVHLVKNGGEQHLEQYQNVNPQALVPTLVLDSGECLQQSLAIIEYLDEAYPKNPLLPNSLEHRAFCRKCAHVIAMEMQPYCNLRVLQYLTKTLNHNETTKVQWLHDWIQKGFCALESWAKESHFVGLFLGGSQVSLADLCLIPQLFTARRFEVELSDYPELLRIEEACQSLDAFIKARPEHQSDYEK